MTVRRTVAGRVYEIPDYMADDFDYWFGGTHPIYAVHDGKVGVREDTGMCGNQAIRTRWTPVEKLIRLRFLGSPVA